MLFSDSLLDNNAYIQLLNNYPDLKEIGRIVDELLGSDRIKEGLLALKYYFIRWYQDDPSKYPGFPDYALNKIINFIENGHFNQAVECCNLMIKAAEENNNKEDLKEGLELLCKTYEDSNNYLETANTKIHLFTVTDQGHLLWQAADNYKKAGDLEKAAKFYGQLDRKNYIKQAAECYEQCKMWKEAGDMYEKAGETEKAAEMYEKISKEKKTLQNDLEVYQVKEEARRSHCPGCGEEIKLHFKMCPVCGIKFGKSICECGE